MTEARWRRIWTSVAPTVHTQFPDDIMSQSGYQTPSYHIHKGRSHA